MTIEAEERFIQLLLDLRQGKLSPDEGTNLVRERMFQLGSKTPDNESCAAHLEVGDVYPKAGPSSARGVKLRDRSILVTDVINAAEDAPIPSTVEEAFPEMTEEEWHACLRFAVLALSVFECETWEESAIQ